MKAIRFVFCLFAALMLGMGVYFCKKSDFMKENNK